ncbi:MAG: LptF/LptG family permease [Bacteroidales bacterium]|nr:LptF/LptG family permease [Bacteroidales bacterium]
MHYKLLDAYILRKYLTTFLLAISLIIIIVITFDVSENMDDFLHNHAPLRKIVFQYYLNFIPSFVNLYSPLFIFIAVIFFTSKMASNTEIIAILGSGITYRRMLRPYMHGAVIVALLTLVLGNFVIPLTSRTQMEFERDYIHTFRMRRNYYSDLYFQADAHTQVSAESFDVKNRTAGRLRCDTYDDAHALTRRITADRAVYDTATGLWTATDCTIRTIENHHETFAHHNSTELQLPVEPIDFNAGAKLIVTMTSPQLYRHIKHEQMRGSASVTTAKIDLYQRLLNPVCIVIMTLIGVAVSSRKSRGGIGLHLAIGISIAFAYIVFMRIGNVFAINGNLAPFLSVLLPQLLFGLAGWWLIKLAPK